MKKIKPQRQALFLLLFLFVFACSGKVNTDFARKIISRDTGIPEKQISVKEVSQYPGSIVADAELKLAFSLQKDRSGQWHVLKISKIPGQWEEPQKVLPASALARSLQTALLSELLK